MKKIVLVILVICCIASSLDAQVEYKQNFLLSFSTQPDIKDCEAAYIFACCKKDICAAFNSTRTTVAKAYEELTTMQIALNSATVSSAAPAMSPDDTKKLSEQLKNMSKEEKRRWAMQNAKNFMPAAAVHVNKDMDNQPVNDAVKSVTDQQAKDLQNFNALNELRSKLLAVEKNDQPQKDEALKKFQAVTGTTYDPSSSFVYVTGEMGEVQAAKFDRAVGEYRKTVLPLFNRELKEKLNCVLQLEQNLVSTYTPIEEAIALTKFGDDAQETSNKMHLMMGHMNVLQKVRTSIETYNEILTQYADRYAAVMKVTPVKEQNEKKE